MKFSSTPLTRGNTHSTTEHTHKVDALNLQTSIIQENLVTSIWKRTISEAKLIAIKEPLLEQQMRSHVLDAGNLATSLSSILVKKLSCNTISEIALNELFLFSHEASTNLVIHAAYDMESTLQRDAAATSYVSVLLNMKGFQAIQAHRLAHFLWLNDRKELALYLQNRISEVLGVDIHPACKIGKGIMFDHATGIVIGETAVIEDNVSILQSVTLGGTGNEVGDRHPKVRSDVMIGAGAKVLGNIEICSGSKIGAGSVVLKRVPPNVTVAGVPAKIVGKINSESPAETMDQSVPESLIFD